MATDTQQMTLAGGIELRGRAAGVARFLWHFLQMALAMGLGMMVYHALLRPLLYRTPYAPLTDAFPMIGYWGMVISMVLGMLALMLYQHSTARYCLQMTAAMVAPIAALTVLVLCSLIPGHILYAAGDPLMLLAMAAFMLYRPHEHAHGSHEHAGHALAGRQQPSATHDGSGDHMETCEHETIGRSA